MLCHCKCFYSCVTVTEGWVSFNYAVKELLNTFVDSNVPFNHAYSSKILVMLLKRNNSNRRRDLGVERANECIVSN